ncbi:MAG: nitroreductase family protein [Dehalococcoidales bacterium]|nr:nitroreductase family protein [Dehalococcoidales bacterium]MDZ4231119.1 nitroreductase family protein [Dehalococcoidales bacterium]
MIKELIVQNRTCRRFYQDTPVELETLHELVELARLSASAANKQPLKYVLSCEPKKNAVVFSYLGWAAQFKDWPGPVEGERPSGYIIMLLDTEISKDVNCDHGIAGQSILLGAREKGLAGCMHASVNRKALSKALEIPPRYEILLVLSLGKPKEVVVIDTIEPGGDYQYWRDGEGMHHVPKRRLEDIIIG